ncbi:MAG: SDR family oxidoreductase [Betaproteobacteria bacterium]|nr:SDR family oxidoreductase [Betaproteobacteria bacterium]
MITGQRVLIFGVNSAIAQAVARLLVQRGCHVYGVGRNAEKLRAVLEDLRVRAGPDQRVGGCQADLDDIAAQPGWFDQAESFLGVIDVVLIAHGVLPDQLVCQGDLATTMAALHSNALSAVALAEEAAHRLQARGAGTIVAIGSVAGDRGRQSNYVYGAAKGMLALYLQGLRNRLAHHGVHVLTVKPGFVDTPMTAGFERKGWLWARPEQVARGIVRAMDKRRDVAYLPAFWFWIMLVIRSIPERLFKRLRM